MYVHTFLFLKRYSKNKLLSKGSKQKKDFSISSVSVIKYYSSFDRKFISTFHSSRYTLSLSLLVCCIHKLTKENHILLCRNCWH